MSKNLYPDTKYWRLKGFYVIFNFSGLFLVDAFFLGAWKEWGGVDEGGV